MDAFSTLWESLDYNRNQTAQMWDASLQLTAQATEIYGAAWAEFFWEPQKLFRRNLAYWNEVSQPARPKWQTPHRLISLPYPLSSLIRLLDFSQGAGVGTVPTLVLPPQAGHHSYIADYSPTQSQVQALRQSGLEAVYCIEWIGATRSTAHSTIEDYIETVRYSIEKIGGKANLVGDCQGGWLAALYAALYPDTVNSLVVAGAPIDFQAGNSQIKEAVNYNARTYPDGGMALYRGLVAAGNGVLDGRFLVLGFNLMKPAQFPERYLNLYRDILDPLALARFRQMKDWYDYPQNIAGPFYLWLVQHLFRDNELIEGRLTIGGKPVDLSRITCPLFLLAGTRDHVTPPVQVFRMAEFVGTPTAQVEQHLVEAGHIGLFMGHDVLKDAWQKIGQKMAAISTISTIAHPNSVS